MKHYIRGLCGVLGDEEFEYPEGAYFPNLSHSIEEKAPKEAEVPSTESK